MSTTMWLAGVVLVLIALLSAILATRTGLRTVTAFDLAVLRMFERARVHAVDDVASFVVDVGTTGVFQLLAWTTIGVLLVVRRFQHLFASLTVLLVVPIVVTLLGDAVGRMRPPGIEQIANWEGYAYPSQPITQIALVLTLATLSLAPRGRSRTRAIGTTAVLLSILALARMYTGVDHPSDVAAALSLGVSAPLLALRLLSPEEAFPVSYRRGVRAHLDVGGRRGDAIRHALSRQLDVEVANVEPFQLSGSAGSTPLRITTGDGALFGKLYAAVHLRSDRWYKLARTVRYGRLEDERPFNSVRRLVQYEDHMLRVFRDAGIPTAESHGIVEITPEREYLLVTELIPRAQHISDVHLSDELIDQSLEIVRTMWDAGLAHRDVKPANLLVADGTVSMIDLGFAEIRPTPWRQAVDLANMMLVLALDAGADRVYRRATATAFTPDEVAEAFAATRTVTVPAQLRAFLRQHDGDLIEEFQRLAPPRAPVAIQRWTLRRIALTSVLLLGLVAGAGLIVTNLQLAGLL